MDVRLRLGAIPTLALALLAAPLHAETVLRYAPSADLSMLDPQITTATTVGQHGLMIYDTLFALDGNNTPRPQMVDRYDVSPDGLRYHFTLRPGLRFHDGQPVTSADVIPSIRRWMKRDTLGQRLQAALASFEPDGPQTFTITLKTPFPFVELALASTAGNQAVILRRQDAEQDPAKPITTTIGSGPFRFVPEACIAGVGAAWVRNPDYIPRNEPPDGLAGGKLVKIDRVEMHVLPDASTRLAALQRGEIDLLDKVPADLVPTLQRNPTVAVSRLTRLPSVSYIRPNHLFPPFDNLKARQALALIVDQAHYMAGYGTEDWWQRCWSYFVCGSPNGTETGSEPFRTKDLVRARQLLAESGYNGEPIVVVGTRDLPAQGALADVTVANLRAIGANVDYQLTDFATLVARRTSRNRPQAGGWNIIHTAIGGAALFSPATNFNIDSACANASYFGWPCDATVERLRSEYMVEPEGPARQAKLEELSRAVWASLPAILTGQYFLPYAWRRNVTGLLRAANVVFWNVEKTP